MTARRDPEGRLPDGSGVAICSMLALVFWAALGFWLIPAASHHPVSTEELSHASE
mgnify:CR=1 FL=1